MKRPFTAAPTTTSCSLLCLPSLTVGAAQTQRNNNSVRLHQCTVCMLYAVERGTDVACGAPNFTDCGPFFVNFPVESNYYGTVITFSLELCVIPCSATFYAWGRTLLMRCDE